MKTVDLLIRITFFTMVMGAYAREAVASLLPARFAVLRLVHH